MIPATLSKATQAKIDAENDVEIESTELDGQNNEGDLVDNATPEPTIDTPPPVS